MKKKIAVPAYHVEYDEGHYEENIGGDVDLRGTCCAPFHGFHRGRKRLRSETLYIDKFFIQNIKCGKTE
jgi:hypothetical protein